VVAVGQSQGSGAALAAAQLAPSYAPELRYLGTVATGLVPALAHADGAPQLPLPPSYAYEDSEEAAFAMIYLLGTVRALHPQLRPDAYLSPAGRGLEQVALHGCFHDAMAYARQHRLSVSGLYARSVAPLEQEAARRTAFDSARVATPVFTGTGLDDRLMEPAHQYNFIASMCHQGSTVEWHAYPGLTHMTAVNGSLRDSLPFVRRLFAGEPVAGNCAALVAEPWAQATARHFAH
jgi:pimeloyl-ACP methyl ester carboxylesterase